MTSTSVKVIWADFGSIFTRLTRNLLIFNPCAQDETRTHTILRPLPPQSSVYTNFTTCASLQLCCSSALIRTLVPRTGLEPAHLAACAPETHASTNSAIWAKKKGAANETRTRDPDLGKVVLYQLSYCRKNLFSRSLAYRFSKSECKGTAFF